MDTLSPELEQRLASLGLLRPGDLRRGKRRVRRLCRDLPAFDSVWIDALVQCRRLTPLQARMLADGQGDLLAAGPFVLTERLGTDGRFTLYRARSRTDAATPLLTVVHVREDQQSAVVERLRRAVADLQAISHPHLCLPQAANLDRNRVVVVSSHAAGPSLSELLVRRGRFPVPVVQEIARQLSSGLLALERAGQIHGDLRLRNVRLDPAGRAALLHAGVLPAISPQVTIHVDIPPDCCDGLAPELIGAHLQRSIATDMYALGCLLWELLGGRAPFPAGDPLARMAAHQTQRVPDIRSLNPDVPTDLAELLSRMTSPQASGRPRSFAEVEQTLGRPSAVGRRRLQRFSKAFQSAAPRNTDPATDERSRVPRALAAAALMLSLTAGVLGHQGARNELLRIAGEQLSAAPASTADTPDAEARHAQPSPPETHPDKSPTQVAADSGALALPKPTLDGVVLLTQPGPYLARELASGGNLTLRAAEGTQPVVEVRSEPWRLIGGTVLLEGVAVRRAPGVPATSPLMQVEAQNLGLVRCTVEDSSPQSTSRAALIDWNIPNAQDATGGRIGLVQTALAGGKAAIHCEAPRSLYAQELLRLGGGPLVELSTLGTGGALQLTLRNSTLRDSAGLVSLPAPQSPAFSGVRATLERCVLDPTQGMGLVTLQGTTPRNVREHLSRLLTITGEESLLHTGTPLLISCEGETRVPMSDVEIRVDGLRFADLVYRGSEASRFENSAIDAQSIATGPVVPGISAAAFAAHERRPYNPAIQEAANLPSVH